MTEQNDSPFDTNADDILEPIDELTSLKARAATMGITYHPSICPDKLRDKINASLKGETDHDEEPAVKESEIVPPVITPAEAAKLPTTEVPVVPVKKTKTKKELLALYHTQVRKDANKLVRIRLTCMNPDKTQWPGEVFDVGNSITGSIKKFVPFEAEDGYHVPQMIYDVLVARKYQQHKKVRLANGNWGIKSGLVREFAVEVLSPLGTKGIKALAERQALNHSID